MADPRPLFVQSAGDASLHTDVGDAEAALSNGVLPLLARVSGAELTCQLVVVLNTLSGGSVTFRVRTGNATSGPILLTLVVTSAGTIFTGSADFAAPSDAEPLYLTGACATGQSASCQMASVVILGDASTPVPPAPSIKASSVELLAHDTLLLTFTGQVVNNAILRARTSYTITTSDGIPVTVRDVMTGPDDTTDQVVVSFTYPTLGSTYTITATGMIDVTGTTIDPTSKLFVARLTKMDHLLRGLPGMYDRSARSTLRNILQAVSRVDEAIGGNRSDTL